MKTRIFEKARGLGFDTVGISPANLPRRTQAGLAEFLALGHHGDMAWMEAHAERRADPQTLWPQARSVLCVGHNYTPPRNPLEQLDEKDHGLISAYARNRDYHDVMKKRLRQLARWMAETYACEVKLFVDTAPVMEKPLAQQAGLGWQGKHTCIVSRQHGSWLFLGEIFTTLSLPSDAPEIDHCGSCTRCLDICPTNAFTAAGKLDARRCLAYLSIEHKGQIPLEFRKKMGNRIYGCDDCLAVCPWNKFAQTSQETAYQAKNGHDAPPLAELLTLDDAAFRSRFSGSPVKRIGRDRFIRNVLVAVGNSENQKYLSEIQSLKDDPSPLVAEMAAWAEAELTAR